MMPFDWHWRFMHLIQIAKLVLKSNAFWCFSKSEIMSSISVQTFQFVCF